MEISDHVTVLDYGELIASGSAEEVQTDPKVIEAYFGSQTFGDGPEPETGSAGGGGVAVAALLEVRNLSVTYGHVEAVRDVSLLVEEGEYVSIIGNNGAGKSSTLKAIAGVVKPAAGEIVLDGKPIAGMASYDVVRRGLSMVPEGRLIFADQTVEDNLFLGAYARRGGARSKDVSEDMERMFALFPILKDRRQQMAGSLSGGEQQMLALSRGLLSRPRLLMIDEMSLGPRAAGSGNVVPGYRNG